jgi:hypothetical protein
LWFFEAWRRRARCAARGKNVSHEWDADEMRIGFRIAD